MRNEATVDRTTDTVQTVLWLVYGVVPIVAGIDKFFHALVDWDMYLSPMIARMLPVDGHTFMLGAGVVEVLAGVLVAVMPRIGGWVVGFWLTTVNLPAMNTPQFDWVKSRMPRRPQPVPPIYSPEVAADAIVWAASARRREISVGATTAAVIWTNKVASGLLDRYLARMGYDAQQSSEAADPERPHNLWHPLPGDHGAHGRFEGRSATRSPQTWINQRLPAIAMAAVALLAIGLIRKA